MDATTTKSGSSVGARAGGAAALPVAGDRDAATAWDIPGVGGRARVTDLSAAVRDITDRTRDQLSSSDPQTRLLGMRHMLDRLEAVWLDELAVFDSTDQAQEHGAASTQAYLRDRCTMAPADAGERVRAARLMRGSLVDTAEAVRAGTISYHHAVVIAETTRALPKTDEATVQDALLEPATRLDPTSLRAAGRHLSYLLDTEAADDAAIRHFERRGVSLAQTWGGMVTISGLLDPVGGATLMSAIDALTEPPRAESCRRGTCGHDDCVPSRPDIHDDRLWPQRRADALVELARRALDSGALPQVAGQRPHLVITLDVATLRAAAGSPAADASWVGPITADEARQLACDAHVERVITDGPHQVLDVGRSTRTVPIALRTAITVRDGTCVMRGCSATAAHCDVHHLKHWADGGSTDLHNCVLLCRFHHSWIHRNRWQITRSRAGDYAMGPAPVERARGPG